MSLIIERKVIDAIKEKLTNAPVESGGILGLRGGIICSYYHDGHTAATEYVPDVQKLNAIIEEWAMLGIEFAGIAHSHPNGNAKLSKGDFAYSQQIIKTAEGLDALIFAVLAMDNDEIELRFYDCLNGGLEVMPVIV